MAQEQPAVVVLLDTDSEREETCSFSEAALSFKDRTLSEIISISSLEEVSPTSHQRPRGSNVTPVRNSSEVISLSSVEEIIPTTTPGLNTDLVLSLVDDSSKDVNSVRSIEELNLVKLSKENIAYEISYKGRNIEEICICCGELEIHTQHPLFHGGMCAPCTEKFLERFFLCDDDGYQADCAICCWGNSLIMCDDPRCHRCFCEECIDTLVHPGHSKGVRETSPWLCFMCQSQDGHGLLKRRTRWREELKHFYDQESNSLEIYQPLSPRERKPIHVLSLFDDITPELKSFGFLGENMSNGRLKYLDDVTNMTRKHIEELGLFDFIFGSTPPVARSYKYPSAWYFYQYFRILQYGRPTEGSKKPFFWLFVDNLVLDEEDRDTASRFFKVEAVVRYKIQGDIIQNAVHVWSNIPSVNSKYCATSVYTDLFLLAEDICRSRIFSERPATLIREFFVPLKDYFRAFF
ncbi:DNA (cytosine-5)-methyltransferase 3-like [Pogona vitticeps]